MFDHIWELVAAIPNQDTANGAEQAQPVRPPWTVQQITDHRVRQTTAMRVRLAVDARILLEDRLNNRVFYAVKVASASEVRLYR
jgi:hypothetical protein